MTTSESPRAHRVGGIVGAFCLVATAVVATGQPVADGGKLDAGVDPSWWKAVTAELGGAEYAATETSDGLQAPNRAQDLRTTFREDGIAVEPRVRADVAPAWRFAWETSGFGRAGRMADVAPATPESDGTRVTYQRDGWSEWYENKPEGLEQGFTIDERPAGDGALRIAGRFPAELRAVAREDGAIDFLDAAGACVLRYGGLVAWDANGVTLASELVVSDGAVQIVVQDQSAAYPLTIDPLMTNPAWTAEPNQAGARLGFSVSTAGDVNGDGFSDVIVGAWLYDGGSTDEGRAYVYHGSASGLSVTPAWTAESDQANAYFGYSVATAGDVNGDGHDDVIVGSLKYDGGQTDEGRVYVYHGSASGLSLTPGWTKESDQSFAELGTCVNTAGDVDGDGYDDVIVGAPFFDSDLADEGRAFVYRGSASGLALVPSWTGESNQTGAQFGVSCATAGDVNADGYADVIVGAVIYSNGQANEGRAFVFHGGAGGLSLTSNWTAEGNLANAYFARSVAGAGDVNGDGFSDVIVGAPGYWSGQSGEGGAFVYHGSAGGLAGTHAWQWEPNLGDCAFGQSVGTAGDINGDGFADVIVGAHNFANGQFAEGRAFVFQGAKTGLWSFTAWTAESNQASAGFGVSVSTAGDVNGDGYSDVIVGAWAYDGGQTDEGRASVYHGSGGGLQSILQWAAEGEQENSAFGYRVASAGDVNGDGYSDVLVGASSFGGGQDGEGRVYLYYGSSTGLSFTAGWTAESDQANSGFGMSLSAGDVNGDGYSDLIVGAPWFDGGQDAEGRVYVYHGAAAGLSPSPAWIAEGNEQDLYFGISASTAGDVNGDGYSDVIVGATGFVYLNAPLGWAYVYLGSPSGLSATPVWTADGGQQDSNFGCSVATAGDVNRDGFSDVIVGASMYDAGQFEEGRAALYLGSASGPSITPSWTAEGNQINANFGASVATAGDVNGDGFSDAIVSAASYSNGQDGEGRTIVYHGSPSGLGLANWSAEGDQDGAWFGASISTAGDVNGDGFSDVVVGASRYDGAFEDQGRAVVYHGSSIGLSSAPAKTVEMAQAEMNLGCSVSTAGDVNGDGFSDLIIGALWYDGQIQSSGLAIGFFGNENDGLDRIPQQSRTDNSAPISILGRSNSSSSFQVEALGRTAAGRGRVWLELEVKPFGVAFDGAGLVVGETLDSGAPSLGIGSAVALAELAGGLSPETLYHWRLRIASDSPFFPRSPWLGPAGNAPGEADLRTSPVATDVADEGALASGGVVLDRVRPNPLRALGEISFQLPEPSSVRLAVYDASGRQITVLSDEARLAGSQSVRWDARDSSGRAVTDGVYFVRLETSRGATSQKIVVARAR